MAPKIFGRRRTAAAAAATAAATGRQSVEVPIPSLFLCPISLELMKDPVTLPTGITYDRHSIESWLYMGSGNPTCPATNQPLLLSSDEDPLIPNHTIRRMIQDWCVANRALGVDRIPTPKAPLSPAHISGLLSDLSSAASTGDSSRCCELVAKIKALSKESERNRNSIASNGAGRVLAAAFGDFAAMHTNCSTSGVAEDILSVLAGMLLPLDPEARRIIESPESLNLIVSILKCGDLAGKLNAALVIRDLVSLQLDKERVDAIAVTDGLIEALVKLVMKPVSTQLTKASLVASFYIVSANEKTATRFVEMGMVPLLLEILVEADKSTSEKALGVLNALCSCELGREAASRHALTVPVVVKKMFRVSEMATDFAVSALWKLCKNVDGAGSLMQALQLGAFQKLLLLLQVGCSEATKDKASDLLKLLNASRGKLECIESMDFKGLKRSF